MLSAHREPGYMLRLIKAGAIGYLLKDASGEILAHAIREVHRGNTYFSASVAKQIADYSVGLPAGTSPLSTLSTRECEVIQLIAEGCVNKEIASELGVSEKTVDKHRQRLMAKLDIHNIAGLTRYAVMHGLIEDGRSAVTTQTAG
jgi:DNA-binding NarL/FixJ family response regulator